MYGDKMNVPRLAGECVGPMPIPERLQMRKKDLEQQLESVNEAIALFERAPDLSRALTLVRELL